MGEILKQKDKHFFYKTIAAIFVAAFCLCLIVLLGSSRSEAAEPLAGVEPGFFGIDAERRPNSNGQVTDPVTPNFEMMGAMGAKYVRIWFPWNDMQPDSPTQEPDWSLTDQAIEAAHAQGLEVVAVIHFAPDWAIDPIFAGDPRDIRRARPPLNSSDYANFVKRIMDHYKPDGDFANEPGNEWTDGWGIKYYELGPEFNLGVTLYSQYNADGTPVCTSAFEAMWLGTMAEYVNMLKAGFDIIHQETGGVRDCPDCMVLSGAVADNSYPWYQTSHIDDQAPRQCNYTGGANGSRQYVWDGLNDLYDAISAQGGQPSQYFDILSVHTFQWKAYTEEGFCPVGVDCNLIDPLFHRDHYRLYHFLDGQWYVDRLAEITGVTNTRDPGRDIWLTETGYAGTDSCMYHGSADGSNGARFRGCLTEAEQASAIETVYQIASLPQYSHVKKVFWWQGYDGWYTGNLGIISSDMKPKDSYASYCLMTGAVSGSIGDRYEALVDDYGTSPTQLSPGYPQGSEYDVPGGSAQQFSGGRITFNSSTGQSYWLYGGIYEKYDVMGGEFSGLGLPVSEEYDYQDGRRCDFQAGYIYWTPTGGAMAFLNDVTYLLRDTFWDSFSDYQQGLLTQEFEIFNNSDSEIRNLRLLSASCSSGVTLDPDTSLPSLIATSISAGTSISKQFVFLVSPGVSAFNEVLFFDYESGIPSEIFFIEGSENVEVPNTDPPPPDPPATSDIYWPWYDSVYGFEWFELANPSNQTVKSEVWIGGVMRGVYTLAPGAYDYAYFTGFEGGPVEIKTYVNGGSFANVSDRRTIVANKRTIEHYQEMNENFREVNGMPATELSSQYYWPVFDQAHSDYDWLIFANPSVAETIKVEIRIGGILQGEYTLAPETYAFSSLPSGLEGGPVELRAYVNGGNFANESDRRDVTAVKSVMKNHDQGTESYSEIEGTAAEDISLTSDIYWSWYDNVNGFEWFELANPSNQTVKSEVWIGGVMRGVYTLAPETYDYAYFNGFEGGPVEIKTYVNGGSFDNVSDRRGIIANKRIVKHFGEAGENFREVSGVPAGMLSFRYYWPRYDQAHGDYEWFMFANPSTSETIKTEIWIGGTKKAEYILAPGADSFSFLDNGLEGGPVEFRAYVNGGSFENESDRRDVIVSKNLMTHPNESIESISEINGVVLD